MKAYRIGIDVGGTKIAYGLFDEDNNLIDRLREATDPSIDGPSLADQILRQIRTVLQRNALEEKDLKGIGVCMPSFILFDEGYICMTSAMTNVRDFPMRSYMAGRLSVPIVLDNDSNCAALAEYRFGAGRGSRHMVYMSASTGIGSGLFYGLYTIFGRVALQKYPPETVTAYTFLLGLLGTIPFSGVKTLLPALSSVSVIALCVGIGLCSTVLPYFLYTWGLQQMESGKAAILVAVEPLVGAVVGMTVFRESRTPVKIIGIALILTAIVLLNLPEQKTES